MTPDQVERFWERLRNAKTVSALKKIAAEAHRTEGFNGEILLQFCQGLGFKLFFLAGEAKKTEGRP